MDESNIKTKRKKRLQEFNRESKIRLIQLVQSNQVIWDTSDKKHFDATHVKSAWEYVAEQLNKDTNSCRLAWKSLRDSHKYLCKRQKKKGNEKIDWEFAPYLSFLLDQPSQRLSNHSSFDPIDLDDTQDQDFLYEGESSTDGSMVESKKEIKDLNTSIYLMEEKNPTKKKKVEEQPSSSQQMCALLSNFLQQQTTSARPLLAYWESELNMMSPEDAEEVEQKMTKFLWAEKAALSGKRKYN